MSERVETQTQYVVQYRDRAEQWVSVYRCADQPERSVMDHYASDLQIRRISHYSKHWRTIRRVIVTTITEEVLYE